MASTRVTFFTEPNYEGPKNVYEDDEENITKAFPGGVGSAIVEGSGVVTLYQQPNYQGARAHLLQGKYSDTSHFPVGSFVNSLEISSHNPQSAKSCVTFFSEGDFLGYMYMYTANNPNIAAAFPRGVGSAKVAGKPQGGPAILYQDKDYKGAKAHLQLGNYRHVQFFPAGSRFVNSLEFAQHNPELEETCVTLFSQINFYGYRFMYTADSGNITDVFPGGVGSVQVSGNPQGGKVTLYQLVGYKGVKVALPPGDYDNRASFPNGIQSLQVGLYN